MIKSKMTHTYKPSTFSIVNNITKKRSIPNGDQGRIMKEWKYRSSKMKDNGHINHSCKIYSFTIEDGT